MIAVEKVGPLAHGFRPPAAPKVWGLRDVQPATLKRFVWRLCSPPFP